MNIIESFRNKLIDDKIKAYIVPTADYHLSEYVSDYFKVRAYLSGFTGSAGTLLVSVLDNMYENNSDDFRLWTDGRYFLQAERELEGSGISLMRMGKPNVPTILEYLNNILVDGDSLGFDGKVISTSFMKSLKEKLGNKNIKYVSNDSYINLLWPNRPNLPKNKIFVLNDFFAGETFKSKLEKVREKMKSYEADMFLLTALEDEAWLYNLRGNDVLYTPVFLSYTLITKDEIYLYVDKDKFGFDIIDYLKDNDIKVKPYFEIYEDVKKIQGKKIIIDPNRVNYELSSSLEEKNDLEFVNNSELITKAIKNETEIKNTKLAHIKDGVAVTKFMKYIKENYSKTSTDLGYQLTELKASDYLLDCRKQQKGFIEPSFNTICAFGANASMLHYSPNKDSDTLLTPGKLLLVDSGGHYLEGTTDITRTYALGDVPFEEKKHYTAVLKSVIALSKAVFLEGCRGVNLDILARGPIWNLMLDYRCGTGHGVGHILSVHEGPNGFRWQIVPERQDSAKLVPGMITTNEPGIYIDNKYGIRIENEMLCYKVGESEYGKFNAFETITYAPIDLDPIIIEDLTLEEKDWLNNYHKMVYETLKPYFNNEDQAFLEYVTRRI